MSTSVYLVGARWRHHARHSGYEHFGRHVGRRVRPVRLPVGGRRGRRAEAQATAVHAGIQMLCRSGAIFHALDGDRDLPLLVRFSGHRGNRLIATLHAPPGRIRRLSLLHSIERLDAAILVSHSQKGWFAQLLPEERLFVVGHGVDTCFFSPPPEPRVGHEPTLITVGENFRDFRTLAAALQAIWRRAPAVRLIAVGVPAWAKRLLAGSGDHTTFLEDVGDDELRRAYRRAHAAVFAFEDASANNALLEAMSCGLPIVATDVGGVPEYVGADALLCPPGDPFALADAVAAVLEDQTLAAALAGGARARSLRYAYQQIAREMAPVYRAIAI